MRITHRFLQCLGVGVLVLGMGALSGCGSDPTRVAVADTGNHRVLIYNNASTTNEAAAVVLGQPDFTSNAANQGNPGPSAKTFVEPVGVAQDSRGNLFVADLMNCRVLEFTPPFTNNMSASMVFGQADFATTTNCNTGSANSFGESYGVAADSKGNLWVSDFGNSRILEFTPPFSIGMNATLAIGQASTGATSGCNMGGSAAANSLCEPVEIAFDSHGNLWATDYGNNRVLEFVPPFSTGMNASLVVGQPDLTSSTPNNPALSANTLGEPVSARVDSNGDLWVTDAGNHRTLQYRPPFSNGMAASIVLGQADFTSSGGTGNPAGMFGFPFDLAFGPNGSLIVSDDVGHRVLTFNPPFSNGMNAASALGQPDLTSSSPNQGLAAPTAKTLALPTGVATIH